MDDPIIRVDKLGKKYFLRTPQKIRYSALRDVIAESVRNRFSQWASFFSASRTKKPAVCSPTGEEFWAIQDVDLEIQRGERLGIIGRNGAGKSTLLKILSRITRPTCGRIEMHGRVASLLEVGTGFHPELTGRENIFLNAAILGMKKSEIHQKFDRIVAFSEIDKFLDTPVKRYSSGMYVRLAFSVAAHLEPEILLVDEVLAVGDISFQKKCLGMMEDINTKEGSTILFVSHNISAIKAFTQKCLLLDQGKIKQIGTSEEVLQSYLALNSTVGKEEKLLETIQKREAILDKAVILHASFAEAELQSQKMIYGDDSLSFYIKFRNPDKLPLAVAWKLKHENGTILTFGSSHHFQSLIFNCSEGMIRVTLPKMNLACGAYWIDIFLSLSKIQSLDSFENALLLNVEACDPGKNGYNYRASLQQGYVYLPHTYSLLSQN